MGHGALRFIHWNYVAPRLIFLTIVVISVWLGLDPLLHYVIVSTGQTATGAKVDLVAVETSLGDGLVELRGLQVADPQSSFRNLFEAERTTLQLDARALLEKRIVVRNGEIVGLEFGTERSESGELEVIPQEAGPSALDPLIAKASDWAAEWLAGVSQRLGSDFADQLQTPKVAQELEERWKQLAIELHSRAENLKSRGEQLETEFREARRNPLRSADRISHLHTELKSVQVELIAVQKEITALPVQVKADREALLAAKAADEAFIKKQLKFERLDGENLTQVLLGKPVAENTQTAIDWIVWARKRMPTNSAAEVARARSRGTNVNFGEPRPRVHIERLGIELNASVAGSPVQFTGSLTNVSTAPRLVPEPARLELIASSGVPVTLEVVSDRRTDLPRDELFLACSAIPLEGRVIGNADKLAIRFQPGHANIRLELRLEGDELAGNIEFKQPKFELKPITPEGRNESLSEAVALALGKLDSLSAQVMLAGTLQRPELRIESAIGQQVADGISMAVISLASKKSEALTAKVSARLDEQLAKLESTTSNLQEELLAKLGENQKLFETLAAGGTVGGLSVPQIGALGSGLIRR